MTHPSFLNQTAADVMNPDILSVDEEITADALADFFIQNSITGASVINEQGELTGVVSLFDLVRSRSFSPETSRDIDPHEYYVMALDRQFVEEELISMGVESQPEMRVKDIMTPMVFEVDEDTPIQKIAEIMTRGRIHRVIVTRGDKPVGIVTSLDMMKIIVDL